MLDDRYAAGLFDGEGCVRIAKWAKKNSPHVRYTLFIGMNMVHRPIIEAFQETYGGSLHQARHDDHPKWRPVFLWAVGSQEAASFLRRIQPYSIVKLDEIEVALELQAHTDAHPYIPAGKHHLREDRDEILAYRAALHDKIAALKKRSYPLFTS